MPLCKYGCGEEVTFIDGKPFSLQNHMKVCSKGNAGKKKPAIPKPPQYEEALAALTGTLGYKVREAIAMLEGLEGADAAELVEAAMDRVRQGWASEGAD